MLAFLLLVGAIWTAEVGSFVPASAYNVRWLTPTTEPGRNEQGNSTYAGGMPIGNGDTVAYVWANTSSGGIQAYISKADAMSSYTELFKLAMLQVLVTPNPFASGPYFNQTLDLASATITLLAGGTSYADYAIAFTAYVDASANQVQFEVASRDGATPFSLSVNVMSARPTGASYVYDIPFMCSSASCDPDVQVDPLPTSFAPGTVIIYHRNNVHSEGSFVESLLTQQRLAVLIPSTPDWWINNQFGLAVDGGAGPSLSRISPGSLSSTSQAPSFSITATAFTNQTTDAATWLEQLAHQVNALTRARAASASLHTAWWDAFWNRSAVAINQSSWATSTHPQAGGLPLGAVLWLRADNLSALPPGASVSTWVDASGHGNDAIQSATHLQPIFSPSGMNGMPAVEFDGMQTFMNGSIALSNTSTIFAVFKDMGSTGGSQQCCSGVFFVTPSHNGLSTHPSATRDDDDATSGDIEVIMIDWAGSGDGGQHNIYNTSVVGTIVYGSSQSVSLVGGCVQSTQAAHGAAGTAYMLGTRNNELERFFDGYLSELLVYDRELNATELTAVQAYLATKWNTREYHCKVPPTPATAISQQYAITRYVQAIQSRTMWPIKFNGMMFVADMNPALADYRQWGPSNWWQNTRLPYWSMLPAGDVDTFETILKYYDNMLPFASARTQQYFNHTGIYFTETKVLFGAYSPSDYGCAPRTPGYPVWLEESDYIHLDYGGDGGTPEIALMVLDHFSYTGNVTALQQYLPIATLAVDFLRQHYLNRTDEGKYVFWPTQVLETYWCAGWDTVNNQPSANCCVDDMPTLSGIYSLLQKLLQLPSSVTTPAQRDEWSTFLAALPPLPMSADGATLAAARVLSTGVHNSETPELYAVHPYRLFTVGRNLTAGAPLHPAINAWYADSNAQSNSGWNQGIMDAALLGMTSEASAMLIERALTSPAPGYRFQGFMPHEQDYEPSADHLANFNSALNWMLLQGGDDSFDNATIVLFPAWPCNWDVSFKLWAPSNTTVEVQYAGGMLYSLVVTPAARLSAVVFANCVSG